MKRPLLLFFISISFLTAKAQWVNIPDSNFGKWLTIHYPTCMQGNPQVGFQMDTTCSTIVSATTVNCSYQQIKDLTAIKYFDSLTEFICNHNLITALPPFSIGLTYLNCSENQLSSIPFFPPSLTSLDCSMNQLSSIPSLPVGLTFFSCARNLISSIPSLPASLTQFYCGDNQLSALPSLPTGLFSFSCDHNLLSVLPSLPAGITEFSCYENQLTILPSLPAGLTTLYCFGNQLSILPSLPTGLTYLDCHDNQLTTLPSLPRSLIGLYCRYNQLTSIPALPDSLDFFNCMNNPNLYCLPELNTVVYFFYDSTSITCLPNYPRGNVTSVPDWKTFPLCDIASGCPLYWNISGNIHKDTSSSCLLDSLRPGHKLPNLKIVLANAGAIVEQMYSTSTGEYSFDTHSFSNYEVNIDTTNLPIQVTCPVTGVQVVSITAADSLKYNVNFGLECKGYDVGVSSLLGRFRVGRLSEVLIEAGDIGIGCTGNSSALVSTTITGAAHYISPANGALTPSSVVGNTITYTIADVSTINETTDFNIVLQTDSNAVLGSTVCITTTIRTPTPDYNPANDSLTMCFTVVNSFDPNDKTVYPIDITQNATWLNYTVQFQNTGNDTAYDIVIRDTLSANLDLESFQYLASSHSPIVQVKGNVAVFTFANINLLDSFHNEQQSHGWLQYRIKTKPGLPLQTQIKNTAYIYFDLNAPVVTNTTVNTVNVTGIKDINGVEPSLSLYPNPASNVLHINTNAMHPQWLTFYDASGRKVKEQAYTNTIDVSPLESGVYLVELKSEEGTVRRRFVR